MDKTLGQSISVWGKTKEVRNTSLVKLLRTSLKLYVLPEIENTSIFYLSADEFRDYCYEIDVLKLEETKIIAIFDRAFDACVQSEKVSPTTKGNYRWALKAFFRWLHSQNWYQEQLSQPQPTTCQKRVYAEKRPARQFEGPRVYALQEEDLPEQVCQSLNKYELFWSHDSGIANSEQSIEITKAQNLSDLRNSRLKQAQEEIHQGTVLVRPTFKKISKSTSKGYRQEIKAFLGWCVNIEGYSLNEISLEWINHSSFYLDYIDWLIRRRNCGYSAGERVLRLSLSVVKYRTYHASNKDDWSDIPLVLFIQHKLSEFRTLRKEENYLKQEEKWGNKEISHQQARETVNYLYQHCSPQRAGLFRGYQFTRKRPSSAFVASWQTYLIIKFLVYVPVRQEELRKLQIGTTLRLIQDSQGINRYAVKIKDHKRTGITGKPRYYPLPVILTKDITTWIEEIRPLAIDAPSSLESWLGFWGHTVNKLNRLKQKIQASENAEPLGEKTLRNAQNAIRAITGKIDALSTARQSASQCNHLFFMLGYNRPAAFSQPWKASSLSRLVNLAVSGATKGLYGEPRYLNPHGFRNTGAKHLRTIGREEDKEAFSALLGHSIEIDDDYADAITNDFEVLEAFVDDWWI